MACLESTSGTTWALWSELMQASCRRNAYQQFRLQDEYEGEWMRLRGRGKLGRTLSTPLGGLSPIKTSPTRPVRKLGVIEALLESMSDFVNVSFGFILRWMT